MDREGLSQDAQNHSQAAQKASVLQMPRRLGSSLFLRDASDKAGTKSLSLEVKTQLCMCVCLCVCVCVCVRTRLSPPKTKGGRGQSEPHKVYQRTVCSSLSLLVGETGGSRDNASSSPNYGGGRTESEKRPKERSLQSRASGTH